ncbi:hypothetical protein DY000_02003959 [Brassica cretica]|uniref:Uncharacterized protein n=1 Tax=Brassica cretica TaxID=69181 RepID=A0ABQ7BTS4_BRACR|nr:hypothetical protein DY000_02003959 [Brassica cretica]
MRKSSNSTNNNGHSSSSCSSCKRLTSCRQSDSKDMVVLALRLRRRLARDERVVPASKCQPRRMQAA